jgi:uncharacterized protein YbjQ (UPF0145 family)
MTPLGTVTEVHGDVLGLIVRARNYFSNLGAQFRTPAGGEMAGYTRLLADSRNQRASACGWRRGPRGQRRDRHALRLH